MPPSWRRDYARYKALFLRMVAVYNQRPDLKMFLELLLSLTTISVFSLFALRPTVLTISQLLRDIRAKEETAAKLDEKIQNLATAQATYLAESSRISLLANAVSDGPSPETLVRQVEGVAQSHALSLLGVTIGEVTLVGEEKPKKPDPELLPFPTDARELPFSISVSGTYSDLSAFATDFQNLRIPARIDSESITASKSEKERKLVLVISGRAPYIRVPKKEASK